jgi:hypothetical protein
MDRCPSARIKISEEAGTYQVNVIDDELATFCFAMRGHPGVRRSDGFKCPFEKKPSTP